MFGFRAYYLHGKLQLVLASGEEPWNGMLVATERDHHEAILTEFPLLTAHPILGKWLYLREDQDKFEQVASNIVNYVAKGDPRFGILPEKRKKSRSKKK